MNGGKEVIENKLLNTKYFLKYVIESGKSGLKIESGQLNCGYEPLWAR